MIRTLRAFFLSRLLREKLLLVAFAVLGVLMWLSSYSRRAGLLWREQRATTATLAEQKQWLTSRTQIEAAAQKAASRLDSARTLDATRLYAEVDKLAREAGLTPGLSDQRDETAGQFSIHSLQVTIAKADWEPLRKFYLSLQARSPYIGIEQFSIQSRANAHAAALRVSSIEIPK